MIATDLRYGDEREQHVCCRMPTFSFTRGTVVLIHGGYWRAGFDASLMDELGNDLLGRGWAVANLEYRRRGSGGEWPAIMDDVHAGIEAVRQWAMPQGVPVVGIGHSVGGQLTLLAAAQLDAVVALAPVTDVARTYREGLGENAAAEFFGVSPEQDPKLYASASPKWTPPACPTLVVHGTNDTRVPKEHSRDFVRAAAERGGRVEYHEVVGLDHLELIQPTATHWPAVVAWMDALGQR